MLLLKYRPQTGQNIMKKIIVLLGFCVTLGVSAQNSANPVYRDLNLLNGWNLATTNAGTYAPGQSNIMFTLPDGQIALSLTNPVVNGVTLTNTAFPDAFNTAGVKIATDVNGDFVANAAIHVLVNNTNWVPVAVTNSQGQYFVYTGTTNGLPSQTFPTIPWPLLGGGGYPSWMYPATTNTYAALPTGSTTNTLTFFVQRGWDYSLGNGSAVTVWDTSTNLFQFSANGATSTFAPTPGGPSFTIITNLPIAFIQGANRIRLAAITTYAGDSGATKGQGAYIINAVSVGQPQP
jgi:hypothetical protein